MKTILRKFVPLLAAFLVTVGGLLAFESFTAERVEARSNRNILVCNRQVYIVDLCIENQNATKQACTGKIPVDATRELNIEWQPNDKLNFIANVHNGSGTAVVKRYDNFPERDTSCWVDYSGVYCRAPHETDCKQPEPDCHAERGLVGCGR